MSVENDTKLYFNNVLIRPKRTILSSRSQVTLTREFKFPNTMTTWSGVPIIAANMDTTGTFKVYKVLSQQKIITAMNKHYSVQDYLQFKENNNLDPNYFMVSTGIMQRDFERLALILDNVECKFICIDVANGYMEALVEFCKKVRKTFSNHIIVAGNVVSREMTEELIINGKVDIVKVGIGGGSACITRLKTGVGMPQLSAVMECADAAHGVGGYVISDGGITCPGDMAKAFGGGGDFGDAVEYFQDMMKIQEISLKKMGKNTNYFMV